MEILKYEAEELNPGVVLDAENGIFELSGKSCPENVSEFYSPIIEWLENYKQNAREKTIFDFKLEYYNTASSKILFVILQKLEAIKDSGKEVLVRWYFPEDDETLEEAGEEYSDLIELDFELIPIESTH